MTARPAESERFRKAIEAFDRANAEDPNREGDRPREIAHADRLEAWVRRLAPDASEALRLAARCQHIRRWTIPRSRFPEGREGYLRWRKTLAEFHADTAAAILREVGYDEATVDRVRRLNLKRGLGVDAEVQTLEDALCLAFLEGEFAGFSARTDEAKMVEIVRKTWRKMSERGRAEALGLPLPPPQRALVERALEAK
jgi:hypothetical protein